VTLSPSVAFVILISPKEEKKKTYTREQEARKKLYEKLGLGCNFLGKGLSVYIDRKGDR
jgi:hypothetical protein